MLYLLATYWIWFVLALLIGGAIGYWLSWRLRPWREVGSWPRWAAVAFIVGLVIAVLHWLPGRAGLYLETLLLLSFWYVVGGLLGGWLRNAKSRAALATAAEDPRLVSAAKVAEETRRVAAAAAAAKAAEDARVAAAAKAAAEDARQAAAKTAEDARLAAAKAAEDARKAAAKTAEDARQAAAKAAEDARLAAAAKAAEDAGKAAAKTAEDARQAAAKAAEDARLAATAKAAEDARLAAAAKAADDARLAAAAKAAEDARRAATAKAADDARLAAAAKAAEDARLAAAAKAAEDARRAAAAKVAEDARLAAAAKGAEDARRAAAAKVAEDARRAAAAKAAEDAEAKATEAAGLAVAAAAAAAQGRATGAKHPGTKPPGIAAPDGGKADDLKLIKGIGPKNEKISNALGVYHFHQIADWTPDEATWVGHHMAFPGRIEREHWIPQAKLLASGGETDHSMGVKSGTIIVGDSADAPLDAAAVESLGKSLPQQAATVDGEADHAGRRPYGLAAPRGGQPDDLKRIRGIGPQNEGRLHGLGIWHFTQIAAWSPENVKWVGSYLAFPGRIVREKWVDQAHELAAGHETEFSRRVAAGKVAKSKDDGSHGQGNVQIVK
jgi:predicted flap endonuclease-1-like 5' DNA nuclease